MSKPRFLPFLLGGLALLAGCGTIRTAQGPYPAFSAGGAFTTPQLHSVSVGAEHVCGLGRDGAAYCWGSGDFGQLGIGTTEARTRPARVSGTRKFARVSAGGSHTCGVTTAGAVYCWGLNMDGQLGARAPERCGELPCSTRPIRVAGTERFDSVTAGFSHSCALANGRAYCWGRNDRGELGTGEAASPCSGIPCTPTPAPVLGGLRFATVSARGRHSCGVSDGSVYCWGDNASGQLGIGGAVEWAATPTRVSGLSDVVDVSAAGLHTCALTANGAAYCWGSNGYGELGSGTRDNAAVPLLVAGSRRFVAISTGGAHACAAAGDGVVFCWGLNIGNLLGAGGDETCDGLPCSTTPVHVAAVSTAALVSAGGTLTCTSGRDGTQCWSQIAGQPVVAVRQ